MEKLSEKLLSLQPQIVFGYFDEICKIPRPSEQEEKIVDYLIDFAKNNSLDYKKDEAGNILISKPAVKGKERVKTVVLQSHVDMVAEKNDGIPHNFSADPIIPYVEGDWIQAQGTTLGADCGIGMAVSLAALSDKELTHGPIECLFTVNEETGLTGAKAMTKDFFSGKILINLDSEDDGELFIGCAGGIDTIASLTYNMEPTPSDYLGFKISIKELLGGHSGDDINKQRANAIKLLNRFLWKTAIKYDLKISLYEGGDKRNAIPREAFAFFVICDKFEADLYESFSDFKTDIIAEYGAVEQKMTIELTRAELPKYVIDEITQFEILAAIQACHSGVISMSSEIDNLVETSNNLASIKFVNSREIQIATSQRSSIESKKYDASDTVKSLFSFANARVSVSDGYPGWKPNTDSEILQIAQSAYRELFNEEPSVKAVHAGLECGLFLEKYPDLDMISFGPTIKDVHSPNERLQISTVDKFWKLIKEILAKIPENEK
ncbi:MAG: aminoacyl-histidine dipeptidase [Prevotellaceae bacterium]|jgi:dipeptidase D|nr:aminoacyl-histidine dipeptidase [Prevotellaceae bacterium]